MTSAIYFYGNEGQTAVKQAQNNGETVVQLHEQYRPKNWNDVVGQEKAIAKIETLPQRSLAGRASGLVAKAEPARPRSPG